MPTQPRLITLTYYLMNTTENGRGHSTDILRLLVGENARLLSCHMDRSPVMCTGRSIVLFKRIANPRRAVTSWDSGVDTTDGRLCEGWATDSEFFMEACISA